MNKTKIIPLIGIGTWRLNGKECETAIQQALEIGYRHIDTADIYQNHQVIGQVIKHWPREDIFLTSKLYLDNLLPERVYAATERFLEELQVPYIDLLLIHWPNPDVNMVDTLNAMLALKDKGWIRHIGVSNFARSHLEPIIPYQFPILTNQIEMHPYLQRKTLVQACKNWGIGITAYRPLAKGAFEEDRVMQKIGMKYGKSPSQVALRWLIEQDIPVIPKASTLKHLKDNFDIFDFELDDQDKSEINGLDAGKRFCAPGDVQIGDD